MTDYRSAAAETHYANVDGEQIAYRAVGSGSPLILANRMRATIDTWDPLFLDTLADTHQVITFDYTGTGYSSGALPQDMSTVAQQIVALADALGLGGFAIGGWSWGGAAAQTLVVEHPDRVTHAVMMGTNPPGPSEYPIRQVFLERAFKPFTDLADEEVLFFEPASDRSRAAARRSHDRINARPDVVSRIASTKEEIEAFIAVFMAFQEDKQGRLDALTKSDVPMLIIAGDNDPSTDTRNWLPLIGKLPSAQFLVLPESGHGSQHQYPTLSARYIATFLSDTALRVAPLSSP
jgi:pimeloyl-ACP methyl ester carboxylesterase